MQKLEKFIIDNREKLELDQPGDGHFERFSEKQYGYDSRKVNFSWKYMLQAAAVAILIVLSSLWLYEKIYENRGDAIMITLSDIAPEYEEAEIYYTAMINRKYNEIKSIDFNSNSNEQEILLRELSEMDIIYKSLAEELNSENGNQMVIDAMIKHYQLKLEIMNRVLEHLQQVQSADKLNAEADVGFI